MKKIIYLGDSRDKFEHETLEDLQIELKKYNIGIGDKVAIGENGSIGKNVSIRENTNIGKNVTIGYKVTIGGDTIIYHNVNIGNGVPIGDDVTIRNDSEIGNGVAIRDNTTIWHKVSIGDEAIISDNVTLKYRVSIGDRATIGEGTTIGALAIIGDDVTILARARIEAGWKITKIVHLINEYRYSVSGYIIDGVIIIQMGCHTRTVQEWENDFWNNDKEFKEGTPEGKQRLRAFMKMKKIMEDILEG